MIAIAVGLFSLVMRRSLKVVSHRVPLKAGGTGVRTSRSAILLSRPLPDYVSGWWSTRL
jgi:hypothetical protein